MASTASINQRFKLVVLHQADKLSLQAQHALRRTMEKYASNLRLVLICNSLSKIAGPIRSRCLVVRIPCPSIQEIMASIQQVVEQHGLVSDPVLNRRIATASKGNLRKAILTIEACRVQQYPFTSSQVIPTTDWSFSLTQGKRD